MSLTITIINLLVGLVSRFGSGFGTALKPLWFSSRGDDENPRSEGALEALYLISWVTDVGVKMPKQ